LEKAFCNSNFKAIKLLLDAGANSSILLPNGRPIISNYPDVFAKYQEQQSKKSQQLVSNTIVCSI
jgi:hypothetical protein